MQYTIGIDSTDSPKGGCTTWTALRAINDISNADTSAKLLGYPRLIRLNPNTPNKTRGNAALVWDMEVSLNLSQLSDILIQRVQSDTELYKYGDKIPGIAILQKHSPNPELYHLALCEVISRETAIEMQPSDFLWPDKGTGIIGALAAVSAELHDFTYELIAYREEKNFGTPRIIHQNNIQLLSKSITSTYSSIDGNRELIAPSGPDPVLLGIRGENTDDLISFLKQIELEEKISHYQIFITNQGTDEHVLEPHTTINQYSVFSGQVSIHKNPQVIAGGHIKIVGRYLDQIIDIMVFEPTKIKQAADLFIGDRIYLHGAVMRNKFGLFVTTEFLFIINAIAKITVSPPLCTICNKRTTSAGALMGYKCRICGTRYKIPERLDVRRNLFAGQRLYASKSAQRHLTKPIERLHKYGF